MDGLFQALYGQRQPWNEQLPEGVGLPMPTFGTGDEFELPASVVGAEPPKFSRGRGRLRSFLGGLAGERLGVAGQGGIGEPSLAKTGQGVGGIGEPPPLPPTKGEQLLGLLGTMFGGGLRGLASRQPGRYLGAGDFSTGFAQGFGGEQNFQIGQRQRALQAELARRNVAAREQTAQGALERGQAAEERASRVAPVGQPFTAMQNGKRVLVQRYADGSIKPIEGFEPESVPPRERLINSGVLGGYVQNEDTGALRPGTAALPLPTGVLKSELMPQLSLPSVFQEEQQQRTAEREKRLGARTKSIGGRIMQYNPDSEKYDIDLGAAKAKEPGEFTPAQKQARIRSMNLAETQKNAQLHAAENTIRKRYGLTGFAATEAWPEEAVGELNELKQSAQDEYENKLSNLGADVTHFDYLQQRQPQRTATRSAGGASQTGKALDRDNPDHRAVAAQILQEAGGDKAKARQIARSRGFKF